MDQITDDGASKEVFPTRAEAEAAVRTLIAWAGDNPQREGLRDTPSRVARAFGEVYGGYNIEPGDVLSTTFRDVAGYGDLIIVRDIPFVSHCEHHMVPFIGKAHIGYVPSVGVVGLSKIARLVDLYARRLQTQEAMTANICNAFEAALKPKGTAVMLEAEHLCMAMRGIQKQGASTITTRFAGCLDASPDLRGRFFMEVRSAS